MDIHTRAVTVQQVMSHFALACPKDEASKLVSVVNFPVRENMTKMTLAAQGVGMDTYFETGDMLLADDYGKVSPRQLFDMVQKVADCAMNKPASDEKSVSLLRDVCAQNPTVQEIMGLFYLMMFKSDQACARVLDAPAPDITLSAVENKLRDMVSNVSTSFSTSSNNTNNGNDGKFEKKGNGNGNGNGNNIVCLRCNQRGHNSVVSPVPSPVASSMKVSDSNSRVGWTAFSTTHVTSDLTDCYVLDSGTTLHVCKDEAQFTTLKPSTGSITGIANTHVVV
ncbi:hypothetical protein CANINC_002488 [Pichia inconspicua]|uniref:Uncharacterized protein n=1 Tax=Pichia inconspicua TaxID=52247 RepID=A0A4T0X129_9ASCO|nr:hypothetical protein CANINC_002488 [[Candida] inconspicua]